VWEDIGDNDLQLITRVWNTEIWIRTSEPAGSNRHSKSQIRSAAPLRANGQPGQIILFWALRLAGVVAAETVPNGGYARASYASGGGGTSRVPRIAGDVTAGPALVSCVLAGYAPCAERRRF
jgi:hypothetical protein